jgi:hypothetical protein
VGRPAPRVFGPSGLPNPLVVLIPAAMLTLFGGTVGIAAGVVSVLALLALLKTGVRHVRLATVVVAVMLAVVVAMVADLAGHADPNAPPAFPLAQSDEPTPAEPVHARTPRDFMVPDLRSLPVSSGPWGLPPAPAAAVIDADHGYQAPDLDRLPRLRNHDEAAGVLATTFSWSGEKPTKPATAVLWLRVGRDGRVSDSQVISSSSRLAAGAAIATVPYLRYEPGEKYGKPVPAWITQRMVVVP